MFFPPEENRSRLNGVIFVGMSTNEQRRLAVVFRLCLRATRWYVRPVGGVVYLATNSVVFTDCRSILTKHSSKDLLINAVNIDREHWLFLFLVPVYMVGCASRGVTVCLATSSVVFAV